MFTESIGAKGKRSAMATSAEQPNAADARYTFDEEKLAELRASCPWKDDPRYFKNVAISPSAVMKMVSSRFGSVSGLNQCTPSMVIWTFPRIPRLRASSLANPLSTSDRTKKNDTPNLSRSLVYTFKMTHCHSGVEKGIKKGGNPIEVM